MRIFRLQHWGAGLLLSAAAAAAPALELARAGEPLDETGRRTVDARLWLGQGDTRFGAGVGLTRPVWALAQEPSQRSVVFGVRHAVGEAAGVYADALQAAQDERRVRVGLEFKGASNAFAGLKSGSLLRVQLSSDANLSLRPRRGGLLVTYRAQF